MRETTLHYAVAIELSKFFKLELSGNGAVLKKMLGEQQESISNNNLFFNSFYITEREREQSKRNFKLLSENFTYLKFYIYYYINYILYVKQNV